MHKATIQLELSRFYTPLYPGYVRIKLKFSRILDIAKMVRLLIVMYISKIISIS